MPTDAADEPSEPIVELARAKINLTLEVLGRRADGYHELSSLVAFADIGDRLTFRHSPAAAPAECEIEVTGPYGSVIAGENIVFKAARLLVELGAPAPSGRVVIDKRLPVASGIGGGSADAAAFLRAIRRLADAPATSGGLVERWPAAVWLSIAARIGADVPVCLLSRSCLMRGIGEDIVPVELAPFDAVLLTPTVDPVPDKTRRVFEALAAPASEARMPHELPLSHGDLDSLIATMRAAGNDLEKPAQMLMPAIAHAKAALLGSPGCLHAFLSGAGPTCVGIYQSAPAAHAAANEIARVEPAWWVAACRIGD
jgi:4-diphosphocytidyl-2-C-methyl-D-erythritol kinase